MKRERMILMSNISYSLNLFLFSYKDKQVLQIYDNTRAHFFIHFILFSSVSLSPIKHEIRSLRRIIYSIAAHIDFSNTHTQSRTHTHTCARAQRR